MLINLLWLLTCSVICFCSQLPVNLEHCSKYPLDAELMDDPNTIIFVNRRTPQGTILAHIPAAHRSSGPLLPLSNIEPQFIVRDRHLVLNQTLNESAVDNYHVRFRCDKFHST